MHDVSTQESDIGLEADVRSLTYLPKLTGNQFLLRELAYIARNFSASEAEKLGLSSLGKEIRMFKLLWSWQRRSRSAEPRD